MPEFPLRSPLRLTVLISGGGTTLKNLLEKIAKRQLDAQIDLVISSTAQAGGLKHAQAAGVATQTVDPRDFGADEAGQAAFSQAIFDACRAAGSHVVVMGGFLKFVPIPPDFEWRVVNIHPALIPAFCGHGFYGQRVHQAVLEYGAKLSGCTVHFVDNEYDHGPIILQQAVPVLDHDTPATLAARVFEAEREAYPAALRLIASGRLEASGRLVRSRPGEA